MLTVPRSAHSGQASQSEISPESPEAQPTSSREGEVDDSGEGSEEAMESTPLTQGRYVERTHAGLISDAARHMDMDF